MLLLTLKVATAFLIFLEKKNQSPTNHYLLTMERGLPHPSPQSWARVELQTISLPQFTAGVGYFYRRTPRQTS